MKTELLKELDSVLKAFPHYWDGGVLQRTRLIDDLDKNDEGLLKALLSNEKIKAEYTQLIDGITIFNKDDLKTLLAYKGYWADSYTKYANSIGLTNEGKYLEYNSDVVLDFPFKDCVLEGGMTKEEVGKEEIYFNEVIARDEIDTLLAPKVFTNSKRYTEDGIEENITEIQDSDNLIIKGNNLIALHSLKERYAGKIKLIYIDPPYNTGNDSFKYNDRFNRSTWLTFMKNRLEIARELLSDDGSIWINLDDGEAHYLKVLADSIFNEENFTANIIWQKKYTIANDARYFSDNHDHIMVYAKNKHIWSPNKLPRTEDMNNRYSNPDNHPKGKWKSTPLHAKSGSKNHNYIYTFNNGVVWQPPAGTFPRYSKERMREMDENNEIWFGINGDATPSRKTFLSELSNTGTPSTTVWLYSDVGHNHEAKNELKALNAQNIFDTPKPEKLIQRILHLGSNEGDLVLDFFMGSGTTQAVAHKMGRQYIGIEQMDYINEVSVPRLQKVIEGEQGGISKEVEWKGGGSFVYTELKALNKLYIEMIQSATDTEQLLSTFKEMMSDDGFGYSNAYFDFKIDLEKLTKDLYEVDGLPRKQAFHELELHDQKRLLVETLDKNQLYVNYSEMEDASYQVSETDQAFTHSFYAKDEA